MTALIEALRTPEDRFALLPGYAFRPHSLDDLKGYEGLRVHTVDKASSCCPPAEDEKIMAKIARLIFGAAIAAVSFTAPALAAHKSKQSAHRSDVAGSRQGSAVHAPASPSDYDPGARPHDGWM
jgi:hypothetical protein